MKDAELIAKVIRVLRSCNTRAQFEVAKKFALRASLQSVRVENDLRVMHHYNEARMRTLSK